MVGKKAQIKKRQVYQSRKAQIKIQEMAFMLVAVMIFFILAGLFVFSIFYSNIKEDADKIAEEELVFALTSFADSPELNCLEKTNCIDTNKLIAIKDVESYNNFWGFTSLRIVKLSGFNKTWENLIECDSMNYPNCDSFKIYDRENTNEKLISGFVALCREEYENGMSYEKCEIGKVIAGVENE